MAREQAAPANPQTSEPTCTRIGAMLYHMLAGAPPYQGSSSEQIIERVLGKPPQPLEKLEPDAPLGLESLFGDVTTLEYERNETGALS